MTLTLDIAGSTITPVIDARTVSAEGLDTGEATVTVRNTATNRSVSPGDEVTIDWDAGPQWNGELVELQKEPGERLTYVAEGEALPLKHEQVYRVFYEADSGDVVTDLVTESVEELPLTEIHSGDDPSNWASIAPVAEPYSGGRAGLYDFGTDLLFLGCRANHESELRTTYSSVPTDAIEDGFFELETRIIAPFVAEWDLTVELKTSGGDSYRWQPELQEGANTYVLVAEDADPQDSGLSGGELRYRFQPNGVVAQNTGFFLDHAATVPFRTSARSTDLDANDVPTTGRTITRRFDESVGEAIDTLATEDQAAWYIDNNTVTYEPGTPPTDTSVPTITEGATPVVNTTEDRDFESIVNEIVVAGGEGVEHVARDQGSISQYNRKRPDRVGDPQLRTESGAEARADGELADRAYDDAAVTFDIADLSYAGLTAGQRVDIDYSSVDITSERQVLAVEATLNGICSVTVEDTTV